MTITKAIHIEAHVYPTTLQDTVAGQEEVEAIRSFVKAIEDAAKKHLPYAGHNLTITEERVSDIRGGR